MEIFTLHPTTVYYIFVFIAEVSNRLRKFIFERCRRVRTNSLRMLNPVDFVLETRQTEDQVDKEFCRDDMILEQAEYETCDEETIPVIPTDFGTNCLIELNKICRCCLAKKNDLQSIFENDSCIPEMIMSLATVEVNFV